MHVQGLLGTQDLGQVYFEPVKDKHGNALLVLLKDMSACPNLDGVRWTQLCKLQLQRKSISSPEEPTALDILLIKLHVSVSGFFNPAFGSSCWKGLIAVADVLVFILSIPAFLNCLAEPKADLEMHHLAFPKLPPESAGSIYLLPFL